jgi:hypothetical protein
VSSINERTAARLPPNKRFQPTPLRVDKIVGILQSDLVLILVSIYTAARLKRRPLGGFKFCPRLLR